MVSTVAQRVFGCVSLLLAAPVLLGATTRTGNFEDRVLSAHNRERSALGIEPLEWNAQLASSASQWAERLSHTERFEHAPDSASNPQGENLWAGTKGNYSIESMVDGWVREKRYFRPGFFPLNSATGRVEDVGHYTQLVWRRTRQVGCALSSGSREDVLVCRYSEAGNYLGEQPF